MKIFKYSLLLLTLLISESNLFAGRGNPIMVIELDCAEDDLYERGDPSSRTKINTRDIFEIDCDGEGNCLPGYTPVTSGQDCKCIPDCEEVECGCNGTVSWNSSSDRCECDDSQPASYCGCPLDYEEILFQDEYTCILPYVPCFEESIAVSQNGPQCNIRSDGLIRVRVTIETGMDNDSILVPIRELLNCMLLDEEGFVINLPDTDLAFMTDENGEIELDFLFDPEDEDNPIPTWVYPTDNGDGRLELLGPNGICPLAPIPTLSTWMIIVLGLFMAISGLLFVKRKEVRKVLGAFMVSF
jgi:hypothetical protein